MRGIIVSSRIRLGPTSRALSRASWPLSATTTSKPSRRRLRATNRTMSRSSSAIRTRLPIALQASDRPLPIRVGLQHLVDPPPECARSLDRGPEAADPLDQPPVRGHDPDPGGIGVAGDHGDDLVVGGVAAPPGGEGDLDRSVPARFDVGRAAVEYGRDVVAGGGGVPVELADQPPDGPVGVVPPAVGPRPDQVHAVDQPARPPARAARHPGPLLHGTAHWTTHAVGVPPGRFYHAAARGTGLSTGDVASR